MVGAIGFHPVYDNRGLSTVDLYHCIQSPRAERYSRFGNNIRVSSETAIANAMSEKSQTGGDENGDNTVNLCLLSTHEAGKKRDKNISLQHFHADAC
jgi:hypothetical protein